jgi:hypothetical protein
MKDKNLKKSIKKTNLSQPRLTRLTRDSGYEIWITLVKRRKKITKFKAQ